MNRELSRTPSDDAEFWDWVRRVAQNPPRTHIEVFRHLAGMNPADENVEALALLGGMSLVEESYRMRTFEVHRVPLPGKMVASANFRESKPGWPPGGILIVEVQSSGIRSAACRQAFPDLKLGMNPPPCPVYYLTRDENWGRLGFGFSLETDELTGVVWNC